jgi:hypothetical protein
LPKFFWPESLTAVLNPMSGNTNLILTGLLPYAVGTFFSLLVAIAWTVAFLKLRHIGAAVLAFASLLGSTLAATSGALWFTVLQGQRQLLQYLGVVNLTHTILVGCLMIAGAFLFAFHRPEKQT